MYLPMVVPTSIVLSNLELPNCPTIALPAVVTTFFAYTAPTPNPIPFLIVNGAFKSIFPAFDNSWFGS